MLIFTVNYFIYLDNRIILTKKKRKSSLCNIYLSISQESVLTRGPDSRTAMSWHSSGLRCKVSPSLRIATDNTLACCVCFNFRVSEVFTKFVCERLSLAQLPNSDVVCSALGSISWKDRSFRSINYNMHILNTYKHISRITLSAENFIEIRE